MITFYIALSVAAFLFAVFTVMGYIIFMRSCARKEDKHTSFETTFSQSRIELYGKDQLQKNYEWFDIATSEKLDLISDDGLKLVASLIKAPKDAKVNGCVLLFHGYHSCAKRDFCIQAKALHDAGYHLILPDQRSHGQSEGKYVCFGVKERKDAISWCKKAHDTFGDDIPICLMGLSMGGATVLMASELANEAPYLRCIVADCPFASPFKIISQVIQRKHRIYRFPVMYFVNMWCRISGQFGLLSSTAAKAVKLSGLPTLIIHGDRDSYVPLSHSYEIIKDTDNTRLVIIENADHSNSIYYQTELYLRELLSFLNENMK